MKFGKCNVMKIVMATFISLGCYSATALAYPNPVAVISNYDEYGNGITISRANGEPDGAEALLYPGDRVTGDVGYLEISCGPYADFYSEGAAYVITYNPPTGIMGVVQSVCDTASSFFSNVEKVVTGASRGTEKGFNLDPKPGFDVTVLSNEQLEFTWDNADASRFYVKNNKGNEIFTSNVMGKKSLKAVPKELGLNSGENYTWSVDGDFRDYKISVLDAETETYVMKEFAKIDSELLSDDEKLIKKSLYVQLISDMYPDKIDLYHLSVKWLEGKNMGKLEEKRKMLLNKCERHLDEEM